MNSKWLVILLAAIGIFIIVIYYFITEDSNLRTNIIASASIFLIGLIPIYLIVESRIKEERRRRQRPVEYSVLNGVLAYGAAIVRIIGMYAGKDELEVVSPNEDNNEAVKKTESFAKSVINEGLQLPQSSFQKDSAIRFSKLLDDMLGNLFSIQGRYPFVIQEYPDIATVLSHLEARQSSIKSAFYWVFLDTKANASEQKQPVEKALTDIIKICDELAETTSEYINNIPQKETK